MISLQSYKSDSFVNSYVEDKMEKIKRRYLGLSIDNRKYLENQFPDVFAEDSINVFFFKTLLSCNLVDVRNTYEFVELYYQIAFLSSLDIKDIVRNMEPKEAIIVRQKYLNKYVQSCSKYKQTDLLEEYQKQHKIKGDIESVICGNNTTFIEFQAFLQNKVLHSTNDSGEELRYGLWEKIIDYKTMVSSKDKMNVVKNLGVSVCPYCNRSYVSNFDDKWKNEERTSADLDHFYAKGSFALFAISLYNFIPSCKVCNSLFKGEKNMDVLYPYEESYEKKAFFRLVSKDKNNEATDIYGWSLGKRLDIECLNDIDKEKKSSIEREINLFRIREMYQIHNEYAEKLRYTKNVLGGKIRTEILDLINRDIDKDADRIKMSEFDEIFYGIDLNKVEKQYLTVPLSKMIHDILQE